MVEETWAYAGQRWSGRKQVSVWVDENGTGSELYYDGKNSKAVSVGGLYVVKVARPEGRVSAVFSSKRFTGDRHGDDAQVAIWEALDAETRRQAARQAAERKHARNPKIDGYLAGLELLVKQCRTRQEAVALRSLVSERLDEAWWKR